MTCARDFAILHAISRLGMRVSKPRQLWSGCQYADELAAKQSLGADGAIYSLVDLVRANLLVTGDVMFLFSDVRFLQALFAAIHYLEQEVEKRTARRDARAPGRKNRFAPGN
jgi:hypothetical protein